MATTSQALTALRNEVEDRIKALTPNDRVKAGSPFAVYQSRDEKPITEFTGKSRTFDLGMPIQSGEWQVGTPETMHTVYHIPLVIVYRRKWEWFVAAADDIRQIYGHLLTNPPNPSIDGVSNRFFESVIPVVAHHPNQPWDYYTLTLQAFLSVTAT